MEEEKNMETLTESTSFLGKGWSFPPEFIKSGRVIESGRVGMTSDEEDIQKSLEILLSTSPGERVMRPDFGCDLSSLSFEPITSSLKSFIKDLIKTSILYHESRITVDDVTLHADQAQEGKIIITIEYVIRKTNTRTNFVFPFYTQEASNIK